MICVPIGLIAVTGIIRSLTTNKTVMRNFYLGVDLGLAALSLAIISGIEPPTRVISSNDTIPKVEIPGIQVAPLSLGTSEIQPSDSNSTVFIKKHSSGVAIFVDAMLLFIAILIQMEFEKYCERVKAPDRKQKWKEGFIMLVLSNIMGIMAMTSSAYILRY